MAAQPLQHLTGNLQVEKRNDEITYCREYVRRWDAENLDVVLSGGYLTRGSSTSSPRSDL